MNMCVYTYIYFTPLETFGGPSLVMFDTTEKEKQIPGERDEQIYF